MHDFFVSTFCMFSMISVVSFITTRKIVINKLKKRESILVTGVVTLLLLFGQDIWLQNMLFANSQKADISVKYF